jgi:hypothetical protein
MHPLNLQQGRNQRRAVKDLPRLHYSERPSAVEQLLMETAARP